MRGVPARCCDIFTATGALGAALTAWSWCRRASRLMDLMELLIRLPKLIVEPVERSSFFARQAVLLGRVWGADGHEH